jgi:hypothetical protein
VCESCAEEVDPDDPTLVRAGLKLEPGGPAVDEGLDILFHPTCFPTDSPVWVRR